MSHFKTGGCTLYHLSLLIVLFQLFSSGGISEPITSIWSKSDHNQLPFTYDVAYMDGGAEVTMPRVEGRSTIYSTQSVGDGQFLLLYEKTLEDGTVTDRYDLLDVKQKSLEFLSEIHSKTIGTYGMGTYVKAAELLIQTIMFESIESIDLKGEIKTLAGQHNWSLLSPDNCFLAVQSGIDTVAKTTVYDLIKGTTIDCPAIPNIYYVYSHMALYFSPDSKYYYSMTKIWGDRINIFESETGTLVDSITCPDGLLANPQWSPDGQYLTYIVQLKDEHLYTAETDDLASVFASRFGIYNLAKRAETPVSIPIGNMIYSCQFSAQGDSIFIKSISVESCLKRIDHITSSNPLQMDLTSYSIENNRFEPIIHDFMEGSNESYSGYIEGLSYLGDVVLIYRATGQYTTEFVSIDLNNGKETVIRVYPENIQKTSTSDWIYVSSSSGLERISLTGDMKVEIISDAQGVLAPEKDAYFSETTRGDKTVLKIQLLE